MNKIIQNLIAIVTGFLSNLNTTDKSNLVAAINEVNAKTVGTNFANTDLTASGDRNHNFSGYNLNISSINEFNISGRTLTDQTIPFTVDMYYGRGEGPGGKDLFDPNSYDQSTIIVNLNVDGTPTTVTFTYDSVLNVYLADATSGTSVTIVSYISDIITKSIVGIEAENVSYTPSYGGQTPVNGSEVLMLDSGKIKSCYVPGLPYHLISIYIGYSGSYYFNVNINTTGVALTLSNPGVGIITIDAASPIFGKTITESFVKALAPLHTGSDSIKKFTLESAGAINYLVGIPDALGSDDNTQYKITMGNPTDGLSDGLLPTNYHIDIKIYPSAS